MVFVKVKRGGPCLLFVFISGHTNIMENSTQTDPIPDQDSSPNTETDDADSQAHVYSGQHSYTVHGNKLVITVIVILFGAVFLGGGGYMLWVMNNQQQKNIQDEIKEKIVLDENNQANIISSPQPIIFPEPSSSPKSSPFNNLEMKKNTLVVHEANGKQVWLDGSNYSGDQLWVSNIDGLEEKIILEGSDRNLDQLGDFTISVPVWNPAGTKIAYIRFVNENHGQFEVDVRNDLYIYDLGNDEHQLIKSRISTSSSQYGKTDLAWTDAGISYSDTSTFEQKTEIIEIQ